MVVSCFRMDSGNYSVFPSQSVAFVQVCRGWLWHICLTVVGLTGHFPVETEYLGAKIEWFLRLIKWKYWNVFYFFEWDVWIQRPAVCSVVRKILEIARSFVSSGDWHILWNCSETRLSRNDGREEWLNIRGEWLNIRDGWWFWGERYLKLGIWPVYFGVKAIFFKKNALLFGIYGKSL